MRETTDDPPLLGLGLIITALVAVGIGLGVYVTGSPKAAAMPPQEQRLLIYYSQHQTDPRVQACIPMGMRLHRIHATGSSGGVAVASAAYLNMPRLVTLDRCMRQHLSTS